MSLFQNDFNDAWKLKLIFGNFTWICNKKRNE
jgi:hypothetical protein